MTSRRWGNMRNWSAWAAGFWAIISPPICNIETFEFWSNWFGSNEHQSPMSWFFFFGHPKRVSPHSRFPQDHQLRSTSRMSQKMSKRLSRMTHRLTTRMVLTGPPDVYKVWMKQWIKRRQTSKNETTAFHWVKFEINVFLQNENFHNFWKIVFLQWFMSVVKFNLISHFKGQQLAAGSNHGASGQFGSAYLSMGQGELPSSNRPVLGPWSLDANLHFHGDVEWCMFTARHNDGRWALIFCLIECHFPFGKWSSFLIWSLDTSTIRGHSTIKMIKVRGERHMDSDWITSNIRTLGHSTSPCVVDPR